MREIEREGGREGGTGKRVGGRGGRGLWGRERLMKERDRGREGESQEIWPIDFRKASSL